MEAHRALWLIARGLFKKVVIASFLADAITDDVFASPARHSAGEVLTAIYAYAAQLYVDFSGYTDMAIGVALLLGFRLPENFRAPYAATSVQDFWNRWHLTLSRWLRDFVLQPLTLGGSRSRLATARNLVFLMLLAGLWHGAAWTFVVWGAIHGVALAAERLGRERRRARGLGKVADTPWRRARGRLVTFHVVAFAWVFFRADSLGGAFDVLARLGHLGDAPAVTPLLLATLVGVLAAQYLPTDTGARGTGGVPPTTAAGAARKRASALVERARPAYAAVAIGAALMLVDVLGPEGVPPFIYFRF